MTTSVLRTFLQQNLLDLRGEDSRLQKLQASSSELGDKFARTPSTALPVLIAALQPNSPAEAMAAVGEVIERHWPTYYGAFQGGAADTLYRAVALQALFEALEAHPSLGVAISLLLRNVGPLLESGKNEAAAKLLLDRADEVFSLQVAASAPPKLGELKSSTLNAVKPAKCDRASILERMEAAVGPHNRSGQAGQSPNQLFPNSGSEWSYNFSDRFVPLLADCLDTVLVHAAKLDEDNVMTLSTTLVRIASALRRSNSLLWWRQALYSESAGKPYREMAPPDLVVHAALDLAALVPEAYERALESFLGEAIWGLLPSQPTLSVAEVSLACGSVRSKLQEFTGAPIPTALVIAGTGDAKATAVPASFSQTAQQWAVWLLRELKAAEGLLSPEPVSARKSATAAAPDSASGEADGEGAVDE